MQTINTLQRVTLAASQTIHLANIGDFRFIGIDEETDVDYKLYYPCLLAQQFQEKSTNTDNPFSDDYPHFLKINISMNRGVLVFNHTGDQYDVGGGNNVLKITSNCWIRLIYNEEDLRILPIEGKVIISRAPEDLIGKMNDFELFRTLEDIVSKDYVSLITAELNLVNWKDILQFNGTYQNYLHEKIKHNHVALTEFLREQQRIRDFLRENSPE